MSSLPVPAHGWSSVRVKRRTLKIGSGKTPSGGSTAYVDDGVPFIRSLNVYDDGFRPRALVFIDQATDREMSATRVRSGDVLLNITGASIGRSCLAPAGLLPANVNQHVCIIRPTARLLPEYLAFVLKAQPTKQQIQSYQQGASREGLNFTQVGDLEYLEPPLPTQKAIAAFLDRKTTAIDALIEKKQKLLDLLAEKRAALINQAVTKGLDPNVPMKDSGIPWIGEIPAHWEIRRISTVSTKITNGYVGPTRGLFVEDGVRYLQSLHIKDNQIRFTPPYFVPEEWSRYKRKSILGEGDVLVVQTGDIGQVAVVPKEWAGANCHALIIVSTITAAMSGEFLAWALSSPYGFASLKSIQTGALHPHLNCGLVRELPVPCPPIPEQRDIVGAVQRLVGSERANRLAVETQLERLKEYRQALITAAVTGQLDITEEAA